jgi:hypothetical protein
VKDLIKLTQSSMESLTNSLRNDSFQWALFISGTIAFKEVMILSEFILDFAYEIISPLNEHILGY